MPPFFLFINNKGLYMKDIYGTSASYIQKLYARILASVVAQGCKGQSLVGTCVYRGVQGNCFVGTLIEEHAYSDHLEGMTIESPNVQEALEASGIKIREPFVIQFLREMQKVHDKYDIATWPRMLTIVERTFNLFPHQHVVGNGLSIMASADAEKTTKVRTAQDYEIYQISIDLFEKEMISLKTKMAETSVEELAEDRRAEIAKLVDKAFKINKAMEKGEEILSWEIPPDKEKAHIAKEAAKEHMAKAA